MEGGKKESPSLFFSNRGLRGQRGRCTRSPRPPPRSVNAREPCHAFNESCLESQVGATVWRSHSSVYRKTRYKAVKAPDLSPLLHCRCLLCLQRDGDRTIQHGQKSAIDRSVTQTEGRYRREYSQQRPAYATQGRLTDCVKTFYLRYVNIMRQRMLPPADDLFQRPCPFSRQARTHSVLRLCLALGLLRLSCAAFRRPIAKLAGGA